MKVNVVSWSRIAQIAVVLLLLALSSCDTDQPKATGFAISVQASGEVVLTDEHIATYIWDVHRILLTPQGIDRWESFVDFDKSQNPPIRKLGRLTTQQFVVMLNGVEMYRGHFSSMVSSLVMPGVLLYDTLGAPHGEIWMDFTRVGGTPTDDPRARPEIAAYFRDHGKLREGT